MTIALILCLALLLDAALGEPRWLWDRAPHPAVLMGRLIARLEKRFNRGQERRQKGIILMGGLVLGALILGWLIHKIPDCGVLEVLIVAMLLAQRSLTDHVSAVAAALRLSTTDGRLVVGRIVGRDTATLDDAGISRAAIESAAENLSDGVVAPALWFLLFGLPGLLIYKITNTADSMIGHRSERYADYGWAAARFDDLLNWPAARLTALLIAAAQATRTAWDIALRDAPLHRSPNAGWPEGAMAGALGIALSGPRAYAGEMRDEPFVNPDGRRDLGPRDIDAAVTVLWRSWIVLVALTALVALVI